MRVAREREPERPRGSLAGIGNAYAGRDNDSADIDWAPATNPKVVAVQSHAVEPPIYR